MEFLGQIKSGEMGRGGIEFSAILHEAYVKKGRGLSWKKETGFQRKVIHAVG